MVMIIQVKVIQNKLIQNKLNWDDTWIKSHFTITITICVTIGQVDSSVTPKIIMDESFKDISSNPNDNFVSMLLIVMQKLDH